MIPEFYARDGRGISTAWVARMRNSTASLTPRFSASRAVGEYTEQHYLPAAAFRERATEQGAVDRTIANCEHNMKEIWAALRWRGEGAD